MIESDLAPDLAAEEGPVTRRAGPDPSARLRELATSHPSATALVAAGAQRRGWTWAELAGEVDAVAAGLVADGLRAGQRLAVAAVNSSELVVVILAALRAGVVLVPLDPGLSGAETGRQVRDCGARMLLVADATTATSLAAELTGVQVRRLDRKALAALARPDAAYVVTPADPEALALLLSTSGISTDPVAAMIPRRALAAHLDQLIRLRAAGAGDVYSASVPLWTAFGLVLVLSGWLASGGTLVVPEGRAGLARVIAREGVTHLPATPPVILRLLRGQPGTEPISLGPVRMVLSAGAALPADLAAEFTERTGLAIDQGYGLTEYPGIAATPGAGGWRGRGHVGQPLPGVEIRIGDGSDPAEPGEIFVRGQGLFSGYWPDGAGGADEAGWFGTGDLGYRSGDDLYWVDRVREAVVVNGFAVYPAEVEQALGELAGVESVAVLGAPRADDPSRQEVVAVVVPVRGAELTAEDVLAHSRTRLARFKQPRRVVLVDELPRVSAGMVSKAALRRMLQP